MQAKKRSILYSVKQGDNLYKIGELFNLEISEIIELNNHPWFIGVQFHPEFKSRPLSPHPLFSSFIKAAKNHK